MQGLALIFLHKNQLLDYSRLSPQLKGWTSRRCRAELANSGETRATCSPAFAVAFFSQFFFREGARWPPEFLASSFLILRNMEVGTFLEDPCPSLSSAYTWS